MLQKGVVQEKLRKLELQKQNKYNEILNIEAKLNKLTNEIDFLQEDIKSVTFQINQLILLDKVKDVRNTLDEIKSLKRKCYDYQKQQNYSNAINCKCQIFEKENQVNFNHDENAILYLKLIKKLENYEINLKILENNKQKINIKYKELQNELKCLDRLIKGFNHKKEKIKQTQERE